MNHSDPQTPTMIAGQIILALLIMVNTIVSYFSSQKRRKQEREDREMERAQEREDRKAIARQLVEAQQLAAEAVKQASQARSNEIIERVGQVHDELKQNTEVNVAALDAANNFNRKFETIAEVITDPKVGIGSVERKLDNAAEVEKDTNKRVREIEKAIDEPIQQKLGGTE